LTCCIKTQQYKKVMCEHRHRWLLLKNESNRTLLRFLHPLQYHLKPSTPSLYTFKMYSSLHGTQWILY
jgi:hypothetical protein